MMRAIPQVVLATQFLGVPGLTVPSPASSGHIFQQNGPVSIAWPGDYGTPIWAAPSVFQARFVPPTAHAEIAYHVMGRSGEGGSAPPPAGAGGMGAAGGAGSGDDGSFKRWDGPPPRTGNTVLDSYLDAVASGEASVANIARSLQRPLRQLAKAQAELAAFDERTSAVTGALIDMARKPLAKTHEAAAEALTTLRGKRQQDLKSIIEQLTALRDLYNMQVSPRTHDEALQQGRRFIEHVLQQATALSDLLGTKPSAREKRSPAPKARPDRPRTERVSRTTGEPDAKLSERLARCRAIARELMAPDAEISAALEGALSTIAAESAKWSETRIRANVVAKVDELAAFDPERIVPQAWSDVIEIARVHYQATAWRLPLDEWRRHLVRAHAYHRDFLSQVFGEADKAPALQRLARLSFPAMYEANIRNLTGGFGANQATGQIRRSIGARVAFRARLVEAFQLLLSHAQDLVQPIDEGALHLALDLTVAQMTPRQVQGFHGLSPQLMADPQKIHPLLERVAILYRNNAKPTGIPRAPLFEALDAGAIDRGELLAGGHALFDRTRGTRFFGDAGAPPSLFELPAALIARVERGHAPEPPPPPPIEPSPELVALRSRYLSVRHRAEAIGLIGSGAAGEALLDPSAYNPSELMTQVEFSADEFGALERAVAAERKRLEAAIERHRQQRRLNDMRNVVRKYGVEAHNRETVRRRIQEMLALLVSQEMEGATGLLDFIARRFSANSSSPPSVLMSIAARLRGGAFDPARLEDLDEHDLLLVAAGLGQAVEAAEEIKEHLAGTVPNGSLGRIARARTMTDLKHVLKQARKGASP